LGKLRLSITILEGSVAEPTPADAFSTVKGKSDAGSYTVNNLNIMSVSDVAPPPSTPTSGPVYVPPGTPSGPTEPTIPTGPTEPTEPTEPTGSSGNRIEAFTALLSLFGICATFWGFELNKKQIWALVLVYLVTSSYALQNYDNCKLLDSSHNYKLYWTVDSVNGVLKVAQQADLTKGWFAVGISSNGAMISDGVAPGTDIYMSYIDPTNCPNGCVADYSTVVYDLPKKDPIQNVNYTAGSSANNQFAVEWTRPLNTDDTENDRVIDPAVDTNIVWSLNDQYTPASDTVFTKHVIAGTTVIKFNEQSRCPGGAADKQMYMEVDSRLYDFNSDQFITDLANDMGISPNRIVITDIQEIEDQFCPECLVYEIRFPNYLIPSDVTTYVSYGLSMPVDQIRHVIRIEPIIDNKLMLHHSIVFLSGGTVPSDQKTIVQGMPTGTIKPLYAWAPGSDRFDLPPNAGYAVGSDPKTNFYAVLSHHYNNPSGLSDQRDSSGMRIYLDTPRPIEAAFTFFGIINGLSIPPDQTLYRQGGFFQVPAVQGLELTVFASFPHMHKRGRKIWLTRLINGDINNVQEFGKVLAWDYNSQPIYPENGKIIGNDTLVTQCLFDTTEETTTIMGGEATNQEMCLVGLAYYPDVGAGFSQGTGFLSAQPNCDYPCARV